MDKISKIRKGSKQYGNSSFFLWLFGMSLWLFDTIIYLVFVFMFRIFSNGRKCMSSVGMEMQ